MATTVDIDLIPEPVVSLSVPFKVGHFSYRQGLMLHGAKIRGVKRLSCFTPNDARTHTKPCLHCTANNSRPTGRTLSLQSFNIITINYFCSATFPRVAKSAAVAVTLHYRWYWWKAANSAILTEMTLPREGKLSFASACDFPAINFYVNWKISGSNQQKISLEKCHKIP